MRRHGGCRVRFFEFSRNLWARSYEVIGMHFSMSFLSDGFPAVELGAAPSDLVLALLRFVAFEVSFLSGDPVFDRKPSIREVAVVYFSLIEPNVTQRVLAPDFLFVQ